MNLPEDVAAVLTPLFEVLPLDVAMPELIPHGVNERAFGEAERAVEALRGQPLLHAGIWLYVDDLHRSHEVSQSISSPLGAYWHGIMHRREGDFWNSKYWFRQAGSVPFHLAGYEPSRFVEECESAKPHHPDHLVGLQRQEWAALFEFCAKARAS